MRFLRAICRLFKRRRKPSMQQELDYYRKLAERNQAYYQQYH